ncbi:LacI family DNA-binding transcriptional regulator [Chelativorans sp. YIM 93263]|uniref:LacI family DNA-binding transcriptional regulator n=1 Tax=Chelativorans sp. YIM 93263 TaxID=2906648 RepID=UPI0023782F41|nr:LacI family DNA-binding transcriptional regulator [Chelativorans sp. YIM 93263]
MTRVTIRDVARYANVSVTTASRALNDTGRMARETRERIIQAAAKLGYRPNSMARGLVSQRSFTIGLLTNDTYGRFTLPVAAGLSAAMVDRGVSVFLCAGEGDPQRTLLNLEAMQEKCVDGLVVSGKRIDRGLPVELPRTGIPTIYINAACPEGEVGFVPDDSGGAEAATLHLAGLGRRRIAHVTGPRNFAATGIRADGWLKALDRMGLAPWGEALFGEWSEAHGYRMADHLFGQTSRGMPDAVFCGNDQIARGMIDRLTEIGVRVPKDVAVVGYDNWEIFAKATRPPLTTVDMGLLELGRQAGLTMLGMIDGKPTPAGIRRTPCTVVVRESCGARSEAD